MIICSDRELVYDFLRDRLNIQLSADFRGVMFAHEEHRGAPMSMDTVGVAYGWHGFIGKTCVINVVVQDKRVLTRSVCREAFRFPFDVCGCTTVLAYVDSTNSGSIELVERSGFKKRLTLPRAGLEGDMLIYSMNRDHCRWLERRQEH